MAEAEEVQYPNNPIVAPARTNGTWRMLNQRTTGKCNNVALHLFMNIKLNYVRDSNSTAWYINTSVNSVFPI